MTVRIVWPCLALLLQGTLSGQTASSALSGGGGQDTVKRGSLGALRVQSEPSGAGVFVNGAFIGVTPISFEREACDSLRISVSMQFYQLWQTTVSVKARDTLYITAFPQRVEALMKVLVSDSNAAVYIDGRRIARGSVAGIAVLPGGHQILVYDSTGTRSVEKSVVVGQGQSQDYLVKLGYKSPRRLAGSLVLPGYSQLADGAFLKGAGILVLTAAAVVYTLNSSTAYSDRLAK